MEWELLGIVLVGLYGIVAILFRFESKLPYSYQPMTRDDRLDQIRGLAMIGIVCIHIHSYFEYFHPNEPNITFWTLFISNLSRFSVPVFILGSAIYLKKKEGYWENKFKSLILPYTAASIVGYFIKYNNYSITDFLLKLLTGQVFAPYYFVPLLFQFYIVYYILPERLKKGNGLVFFFSVSTILNLLSNLNLFNNLLPNVYHSISIFNFIFFFALGLVIRELPINNSEANSISSKTLIFLYLAAIGLILPISGSNINLKNHHLVYPLLVILILNHYLSSETTSMAGKTLKFIGKNSLYIFLIHPFVIHQMHAIDPVLLIHPVVGYLLTLLLNLGIPSLVASLITSLLQTLSNRPRN